MKLSCYTNKNSSCEALCLQNHYFCSLGYSRYYGFIRPIAALRYFWYFLTGSLPFRLALQRWFSCSLPEPKQGSCHLNAVERITSSQVAVMLGLSESLPPRFCSSKGCFRHVDSGSLAFNSPALTIQAMILQLTALDLTMSLSTDALYISTTWRFDKYA